MSQGLYFLGTYTISKLLTDSEGVQMDDATWNGGLWSDVSVRTKAEQAAGN